MKKLKPLLCALLLALAFSTPTLAGEVPIGGFCDSAECVQANSPADGGMWMELGFGLWMVTSIF